MADKLNLDFDCPQFVDFAAELNNSSKDDVFFDCKDFQSPEDESVYKSVPTSESVDNQYPEEGKLIEKMTAALSVIENTPKLKINAVKRQHLAESFASNVHFQSVKPTLKANTARNVGLHRSKSIARLNKIITESQNNLKGGLRKRSSSLNDLPTLFKKPTNATTPMCLKRTIVKAKGKVIKTTEEMELEEIARLQQQLKDHLRHNEMTLRRLKLRPRPYVIPKNTHAKVESLKEYKGLNTFMEKLNAPEKKSRKTIPTRSHNSMKNVAMKIENIIKGQSAVHKPADKGMKENKESRHASTSSDVEVNEKDKSQATKKPVNVTVKKIGFHSGLVFHDKAKKSTVVQPFSFDTKIREKFTGSEQKAEASYSNSSLKYKVDDGKENIPYSNAQSTLRKTRGMHHPQIKCDIVKQLAANKKIVDKYVRNPIRGLPLSENIARK